MKRLTVTLIYGNRLHAWWSTQSRLTILLSSLIALRWAGLQTLWRFHLRLVYWWDGRGLMLWLLSGPRGLPIRFLLLQYSVLFTVESLSLLYLLFISWYICSRRWCIDKLCVFHTNQTSMCLNPHLNYGWGWRHKTGLSPQVKCFYWPSKGGTSCVDRSCYFYLVFVMLSCTHVYWCLVVTCWERADLLALVCDV